MYTLNGSMTVGSCPDPCNVPTFCHTTSPTCPALPCSVKCDPPLPAPCSLFTPPCLPLPCVPPTFFCTQPLQCLHRLLQNLCDAVGTHRIGEEQDVEGVGVGGMRPHMYGMEGDGTASRPHCQYLPSHTLPPAPDLPHLTAAHTSPPKPDFPHTTMQVTQKFGSTSGSSWRRIHKPYTLEVRGGGAASINPIP